MILKIRNQRTPHLFAAARHLRGASLRSGRDVCQPPPAVLVGGRAAMLAWEDDEEDSGRLPVTCRLTCRVHNRWLHECIASPSHISGVAGHRWCRRHGCATSVVVDELTRAVTMKCPRCGSTQLNGENQAMLAACRRSIHASRTGYEPRVLQPERAA